MCFSCDCGSRGVNARPQISNSARLVHSGQYETSLIVRPSTYLFAQALQSITAIHRLWARSISPDIRAVFHRAQSGESSNSLTRPEGTSNQDQLSTPAVKTPSLRKTKDMYHSWCDIYRSPETRLEDPPRTQNDIQDSMKRWYGDSDGSVNGPSKHQIRLSSDSSNHNCSCRTRMDWDERQTRFCFDGGNRCGFHACMLYLEV